MRDDVTLSEILEHADRYDCEVVTRHFLREVQRQERENAAVRAENVRLRGIIGRRFSRRHRFTFRR